MNSNTQQKAVIYVRVSSLGQVTKGHGAESQAVRCAEYAKHKGYEIVRIFEDKAVSGSVIDRPGMKQMLSYLRDHSGFRTSNRNLQDSGLALHHLIDCCFAHTSLM